MKGNHPHEPIYLAFDKHFKERTGREPLINFKLCGALIKRQLKHHSVKGLVYVINEYAKHEHDRALHLPTILSNFFIEKYISTAKLDPLVYENAEEWNKTVY